MEASQAAQGDAGQSDGQQQAAAPDVGALAGQLEQMRGDQEQLRDFLMTQPWQQQQEAQEGPQEPAQDDQMDLSFLDAADPAFDPERGAERLSALIEQAAEKRAQALVAPVEQRVQSMEQRAAEQRREAEAERLVGEFPELAENEVAQQVVQTARQIAEAYGQPELAHEPWFWRMSYMAGRAAEQHAQEGRDAPQAAHLEGGAGARPGSQQVDRADEILQPQRRGRGVLPF